MSAAPNEDLRSHSSEKGTSHRAAAQQADHQMQGSKKQPPGLLTSAGFPALKLAVFTSITHMALLGSGAAVQLAVSPAQAATFGALGPATHASLLVMSGTAAAFFAIVAGRQSQNAQIRARRYLNKNKHRHAAAATSKQHSPAAPSNLAYNAHTQPSPARRDFNRDWSELMARTSHDLRTPLNAVIGFADVMHRELLGPIGHDRYKEYIGHIRDASLDLLKSTETTLAITAMATNPATNPANKAGDTIVLDTALKTAWESTAPLAGQKGLKRVTTTTGNCTTAYGNGPAVQQSIVHLLSEAMSKAKSGSEISISVIEHADALQVMLGYCAAHAPNSQAHLSNAPQDRPDDAGAHLASARLMLALAGTELIETANAGSTNWMFSLPRSTPATCFIADTL